MSESMKIPYNTWGGVPQTSSVQTSRNLTISAGEVPYNYAPLVSDLYISSDLTDVKPLKIVTNMNQYAQRNIYRYGGITSIPEEHSPNAIDTSLAQNWYEAFANCSFLENLPNPFYNTNNATNLNGMFWRCFNLTTVPNFNTSNVTDMSRMFWDCYNLTTLPNFNTANVTSIDNMFRNCRNLTIVPNFNTSNVTDMSEMFNACYNLTTVPNFDTNKVRYMDNMFFRCYNLTASPNFNTNGGRSMSGMFSECTNLIYIPIFNTSNLSNISEMFFVCDNVQGNLYLSSNYISNASGLFSGCSNYVKNIYCHANKTTYKTIYRNMGNNTYNSNWNTYLKTFENDPIGSISQIDSIQIDSIPDGEIYQNTAIFRSPVNTCAVYISAPDNRTLFTSPNFKLDPYTDYNFKVEFVAPTTSPTDPVDPESLASLTPMNLQIYAVSNTSNICIANTSGIFLPSGMNTIDIYINGYYPKTGDPESNINICNIN